MSDQDKMEEYRRQVEARVAEEAQDLAEEGSSEEAEDVDIAYVRKCYNSNEVGESKLYNTLHRGKFVYNTIAKHWMVYVGPHWEVDHTNRSLAAVEAVAMQFVRLLELVNEELEKIEGDDNAAGQRKKLFIRKKAIIQRIDRLRSARGRAAVLSCAISNDEPLTVQPEQLDQHPWLLPVKNGVIDLRTGEARPGRPQDYFTMTSPIEWKGINEPAPLFNKFLLESLNHNQEVVDFLLRTLGYGITGLDTERLFVVLFGEHGQNGKGQLMKIVRHVLGNLAGTIPVELLLATKFTKGADGPTPALMALKGRRIAWGSEPDDGQSFAAGKLKWFSGGDELTGRHLNEKYQIEFAATHTLFVLTNTLPKAPAWDDAFWERIKVIDFPLSFVVRSPMKDASGNDIPVVLEKYQRHADRNLLEKLKQEASGILAALVRGCLEWQAKSLSPPRKVIEDSLKYRRKQDDLQDFIDANCQVNPNDREAKTTVSDLYKRYRVWWEDVATTRPMNMKKFGTLMSMKFEKVKASNIYYLGITLDVTKIAGDQYAEN